MTTTEAPTLNDRISDAAGRDRVLRYGEGNTDLSKLSKNSPFVLDEDMRQVLARTADSYAEHALRTIEERDAAGMITDDSLDRLAALADRYFDLAEALRAKRPLKLGGKAIVADRVEGLDDE